VDINDDGYWTVNPIDGVVVTENRTKMLNIAGVKRSKRCWKIIIENVFRIAYCLFVSTMTVIIITKIFSGKKNVSVFFRIAVCMGTGNIREENRSLRLVQRTGAKGCRRHGARH